MLEMITGHTHVSKGLRAIGQTGSLDGRSKLRQKEEGPNHKESQNKFLKKDSTLVSPSFISLLSCLPSHSVPSSDGRAYPGNRASLGDV